MGSLLGVDGLFGGCGEAGADDAVTLSAFDVDDEEQSDRSSRRSPSAAVRTRSRTPAWSNPPGRPGRRAELRIHRADGR